VICEVPQVMEAQTEAIHGGRLWMFTKENSASLEPGVGGRREVEPLLVDVSGA
jgi:hypothetical protein